MNALEKEIQELKETVQYQEGLLKNQMATIRRLNDTLSGKESMVDSLRLNNESLKRKLNSLEKIITDSAKYEYVKPHLAVSVNTTGDSFKTENNNNLQ